MAVVTKTSGNNTANSTEWSLTSNTSYDTGDALSNSGVYQAFIDVSDMVAGDILIIKIYEKVRSGGTQRIVYQSYLTGAQADPIWVSPSLMLLNGWDITATANSGSIVIDWSIREIQ